MTTRTYSTPISHANTEGFRAWGLDLSTNLAAAGLVQTADTGQIDWATINKPAVNTAAGYEIWRLPGANPIFIKIEYGTSVLAATTAPGIFITTGESSDGAGNLVGGVTTRNQICPNFAPDSTTTAYPTYICVTEASFGLLFKANSVASTAVSSMGFLQISKTVDGAGVTTEVGYFRINSGVSSAVTHQSVRRMAPVTVFPLRSNYCWMAPAGPLSALDAEANLQFYTVWSVTPSVVPVLHLCGYVVPEIPAFSSFEVAMVGSTLHTYMTLGRQVAGSESSSGTSSATYSLAMFWE